MPENKMHPAFTVFIAACIYNFFAYGLFMNSMGLFLVPITKALDFTYGAYSISTTTRALCGAVGTVALGFFMPKFKSSRHYFAILSLAFVVIFLLHTTFTQLWQFYVAAVIQGLVNGMAIYSTCSILMTQWFTSPAKYIGITGSLAGVGGIIFSPILGWVFANYSWKAGYFIFAGVALLVLLPLSLCFLRYNPDEIGAEPYDSKVSGADESKATLRSLVSDMSSKEAFRQPIMIAVIIYLAASAMISGIFVQVPAVLASKGFGSILVGAVTSFYQIGTFLSQFIIGFLIGRIGYRYTGLMYCAIVAVGSIGVVLVNEPVIPVFAGLLFCLGMGRAFGPTQGPILVRAAFGAKDYRQIWSKIYPVFIVISASLATIMGYVYDLTGSFSAVFMFMSGSIVVLAVAIGVITAFIARREREAQKPLEQLTVEEAR